MEYLFLQNTFYLGYYQRQRKRDLLIYTIPIPLVTSRDNGAYQNKKGEGKSPSLPSNHESDIQIFQCQCIIVPEKVFPDKFQPECLVIPVFIILGAEVLVTVAGHVLLEEASQVL